MFCYTMFSSCLYYTWNQFGKNRPSAFSTNAVNFSCFVINWILFQLVLFKLVQKKTKTIRYLSDLKDPPWMVEFSHLTTEFNRVSFHTKSTKQHRYIQMGAVWYKRFRNRQRWTDGWQTSRCAWTWETSKSRGPKRHPAVFPFFSSLKKRLYTLLMQISSNNVQE